MSLVGDEPQPTREVPYDHRVDRELEGAVVVEFPLRGERWVAVTTPGDRIPSHGVNMLGQRYAYDRQTSRDSRDDRAQQIRSRRVISSVVTRR